MAYVLVIKVESFIAFGAELFAAFEPFVVPFALWVEVFVLGAIFIRSWYWNLNTFIFLVQLITLITVCTNSFVVMTLTIRINVYKWFRWCDNRWDADWCLRLWILIHRICWTLPIYRWTIAGIATLTVAIFLTPYLTEIANLSTKFRFFVSIISEWAFRARAVKIIFVTVDILHR